MQGWIKLHRKMLNSSVFQNPNILKFWVWCLLKASHTEYTTRIGIQEVTLLQGQFPFGRNVAAVELNMNPSTIYKYLNLLEGENLISTKRNNKYTVVTIEKWELYQSDNEPEEQQKNNKRTTKEQQSNTNKNVKNDKECKEDIYSDLPSEIHEPLKKYIEMRKGMGKQKAMSEQAVKLLIGKLNKLAPNNTELQIAMLEDATLKNWLSVYLPKPEQSANPFKDKLKEMMQDEQSRDNSPHVGYQGGLSKLLQEPNRD